MTHKVNLTAKNLDYATFTPAISTFYSGFVSRQRYGKGIDTSRVPAKFEHGVEGLNFLNKDEGYFNYSFGLYSAGHAELNLDKADERDSMIQERDRESTLILGDSGGFQISKGVWQGDWIQPEGSDIKTDAMRQKVLDWLEHTADYSMMLDIPTNGLKVLNEDGNPRCGLANYDAFRDATVANNNYFVNHRQGKTKFLNVLQGSTYAQADDWFENVCMPIENETSGWAFGGLQKSLMNHSLRRIIYMKEMGLLDKGRSEWIHFLGTGRLDHAIIFSGIQKSLRKHVNDELIVSYDCASPFIAVANGLVYTHNVFTPKRFSYIMEKMVDDKMPYGKNEPWSWQDSPIAERLSWKDINWYDPGDLNKIGKEGRTSWDSFGYALMMGHNVYKHIEATQNANRLVARPSRQMKSWVPPHYLEYVELIDDLISKDYNKDMGAIDAELEKHELLFAKLSRTKVLKKDNTYNDFFGLADTADEDTFDPDEEDDALRALEESMTDE